MRVVNRKGEVGSDGRLRLDVPVELCPERARHPSPSHPVPLFPLPWEAVSKLGILDFCTA